jgi:histone-lysine N-methyltransferase SETD2
MADGAAQQEELETDVRDMNLKEEDGDLDMDTMPLDGDAPAAMSRNGTPLASHQSSRSPVKQHSAIGSPAVKSDQEDVVGGEVTLKTEPGKPPKLSRSTSHKVEKRAPQLFHHYEDKTAEAKSTFSVLPECTYANKYLGTTEHALECDCVEEWGKSTPCPRSRMHVVNSSPQIQPPDPMKPAVKIRTASTAPPRWSAWVIAGAVPPAKIAASNSSNTRMSR